MSGFGRRDKVWVSTPIRTYGSGEVIVWEKGRVIASLPDGSYLVKIRGRGVRKRSEIRLASR